MSKSLLMQSPLFTEFPRVTFFTRKFPGWPASAASYRLRICCGVVLASLASPAQSSSEIPFVSVLVSIFIYSSLLWFGPRFDNFGPGQYGPDPREGVSGPPRILGSGRARIFLRVDS